MVEHLPTKNRGRWIVMINFFITIGKLIGVLFSYLFLDNLTQGNWQKMVATTAIFPIFTALGVIFILRESPRFCLFNNQESRCFTILNQIKTINLNFPKFLIYLENDNSIENSN